MDTQDLTVLTKMLSALLRHENLLMWIDCWAAGANEGGRYVSLFSSRAQYRICAVYEEKFAKLPPFIRDAIPADATGDTGTERARAAQAGKLIDCAPFAITRYSVSKGDDLKWTFGDVLYIAKQPQPEMQPPAQAAPAPPSGDDRETHALRDRETVAQQHLPSSPPAPRADSPPHFENVKAAIDWAVERGAYKAYAQAKVSYDAIKRDMAPDSAGAMWAAWIGHVNGRVNRQIEMQQERQRVRRQRSAA